MVVLKFIIFLNVIISAFGDSLRRNYAMYGDDYGNVANRGKPKQQEYGGDDTSYEELEQLEKRVNETNRWNELHRPRDKNQAKRRDPNEEDYYDDDDDDFNTEEELEQLEKRVNQTKKWKEFKRLRDTYQENYNKSTDRNEWGIKAVMHKMAEYSRYLGDLQRSSSTTKRPLPRLNNNAIPSPGMDLYWGNNGNQNEEPLPRLNNNANPSPGMGLYWGNDGKQNVEPEMNLDTLKSQYQQMKAEDDGHGNSGGPPQGLNPSGQENSLGTPSLQGNPLVPQPRGHAKNGARHPQGPNPPGHEYSPRKPFIQPPARHFDYGTGYPYGQGNSQGTQNSQWNPQVPPQYGDGQNPAASPYSPLNMLRSQNSQWNSPIPPQDDDSQNLAGFPYNAGNSLGTQNWQRIPQGPLPQPQGDGFQNNAGYPYGPGNSFGPQSPQMNPQVPSQDPDGPDYSQFLKNPRQVMAKMENPFGKIDVSEIRKRKNPFDMPSFNAYTEAKRAQNLGDSKKFQKPSPSLTPQNPQGTPNTSVEAIRNERGLISGQQIMKMALKKLEKLEVVEKQTLAKSNLTEDNANQSGLLPSTRIVPRSDDFGSPIKWVRFNSDNTADGLAKVTDTLTGKNKQLVINGTIFVPVIDRNLERLGWTTEEPTTRAAVSLTTDGLALRVVMNTVDLKQLDERDWLAFEAVLGNSKMKFERSCDAEGCKARCEKLGCQSVCGGDTCVSGCIGASCGAYCKGPGCRSMCIGDYCSSRCEGMNCEAQCRGKGCDSSCRMFSCSWTTNGVSKQNPATWEQYPQYG